MRIIIVGIGKVGKVLTEYLSQEDHDVIIIDNNPVVIEQVVDVFDVRGVLGNGASYEVQVEAEAAKTDLLIATTNSDELNILCCLVGKKSGIKHTIARIRNPEYSKQIEFMSNDLGISLVVNPEFEAAHEIVRLLRFPSATKIEFFANGRAEIVEIKLVERSPLVGKTLADLRNQFGIRFLVCAIDREGEVLIPTGNSILNVGDKIYLVSSLLEINNFFKKLGILKNRCRNVMIIGGGKISYYLSKLLIETHVKVRIVEKDKERCHELSELLPEANIIYGDGSNHQLLIEEGINTIDAVVTLTGYDEENIIISLFAESVKGPKVITKVNHYTYSNILESIGLDAVISPKLITAHHILRFVRSINTSNIQNLYKLINDQIEAVEFQITEETEYTGVTLNDLELKKDNLIACIIRNNQVIIPIGDDVIKPKDSIIVITKGKYLTKFEDVLK